MRRHRSTLFGLLRAVVVRLAHYLQIVLIPEQAFIASMWGLVVNDRTVLSGMLSDAEHASCLARVVVAKQDLAPKLHPSCGLVPGTPRLGRVASA